MTDEGLSHAAPLGVVLGSAAAELAIEPPAGVSVVLRHHPAGGGFVPAHLVDHRANLDALRAAGCGRVLSINSVGSLRTDWGVGTVVAPDDFFAPHVTPTIHDDAAGHAVPGFDLGFRRAVLDAWYRSADLPLLDGGVYAQTAGPRFETPAEVRFLATVADVVGMTVASECILARELGLAYAAVCVVDNLGNGLDAGGAALTIESFEAGKAANRAAVARAVAAVVADLAAPPDGTPAVRRP